MVVNKYEILSEIHSGALLRLFTSQVNFKKRPLENHHHTMIEISLIKQGSGIYTVSDRTYEIHQGDIFIYSSDEPHCITEITSNVDMIIMNVHFEPRFVWAPGNGMFDEKYLRVFNDRGEDFSNRLKYDSEDTAEITRQLLDMENEFERAEPEYELMVKIRLLTVLVLLCRSCGFADNVQTGEFKRANLSALDAVMDYINQNLALPLSLDELARQANMSRAYFSTTFRRLNGISPWEYIMVKRIETAISLLEHTNDTIIEIACKCGFNNTANFNRAFKKITNRTPSSYRGG
ncbi:MAG: AraC family transcriptional regulator [Clostridiales bacterium]|nr:AraC family transcriptional regulator [Clostridiales bacterium]